MYNTITSFLGLQVHSNSHQAFRTEFGDTFVRKDKIFHQIKLMAENSHLQYLDIHNLKINI